MQLALCDLLRCHLRKLPLLRHLRPPGGGGRCCRPRAPSGLAESWYWRWVQLRAYELGSRLGEERDARLETAPAGAVRRQLAGQIPPVDRLAEDGRLPERERLEPRQRLDVTAASTRVTLDELATRGEAICRRDRRRPERIHAASGLAVGRDEIADVGARVADRTHFPIEHRRDSLRLLARDDHVSEAVIAVDG